MATPFTTIKQLSSPPVRIEINGTIYPINNPYAKLTTRHIHWDADINKDITRGVWGNGEKLDKENQNTAYLFDKLSNGDPQLRDYLSCLINESMGNSLVGYLWLLVLDCVKYSSAHQDNHHFSGVSAFPDLFTTYPMLPMEFIKPKERDQVEQHLQYMRDQISKPRNEANIDHYPFYRELLKDHDDSEQKFLDGELLPKSLKSFAINLSIKDGQLWARKREHWWNQLTREDIPHVEPGKFIGEGELQIPFPAQHGEHVGLMVPHITIVDASLARALREYLVASPDECDIKRGVISFTGVERKYLRTELTMRIQSLSAVDVEQYTEHLVNLNKRIKWMVTEGETNADCLEAIYILYDKLCYFINYNFRRADNLIKDETQVKQALDSVFEYADALMGIYDAEKENNRESTEVCQVTIERFDRLCALSDLQTVLSKHFNDKDTQKIIEIVTSSPVYDSASIRALTPYIEHEMNDAPEYALLDLLNKIQLSHQIKSMLIRFLPDGFDVESFYLKVNLDQFFVQLQAEDVNSIEKIKLFIENRGQNILAADEQHNEQLEVSTLKCRLVDFLFSVTAYTINSACGMLDDNLYNTSKNDTKRVRILQDIFNTKKVQMLDEVSDIDIDEPIEELYSSNYQDYMKSSERPGAEAVDMLSGKQKHVLIDVLKWHSQGKNRKPVDLLLFSGGGNGIVGEDDFERFLRPYKSCFTAKQCVRLQRLRRKCKQIKLAYAELLAHGPIRPPWPLLAISSKRNSLLTCKLPSVTMRHFIPAISLARSPALIDNKNIS